MTTLLLVRFGNSKILKDDSLIERAADADDRRIRDESQQSDARIRERLQNIAEGHYLFSGSQSLTRAGEEIRTINFVVLQHEAPKHPCRAPRKAQAP
jgi:hypothetical protein